eukprot:jgi/Mesvir1/15018/Mv14676-RA.1
MGNKSAPDTTGYPSDIVAQCKDTLTTACLTAAMAARAAADAVSRALAPMETQVNDALVLQRSGMEEEATRALEEQRYAYETQMKSVLAKDAQEDARKIKLLVGISFAVVALSVLALYAWMKKMTPKSIVPQPR